MFKKILYPIKFEEFSIDILSCILNFKKGVTQEIILLHVLDISKIEMNKYEGYDSGDLKKLKEIADIKMIEVEKIIKKAGILVKKLINVGIPYREILKAAEEEKV